MNSSSVRRIVTLVAVGSCFVAVGACNRDTSDRYGENPRTARPEVQDQSGTTTITGANLATVSNGSAIDQIVGARCNRESACNNVGADKRFVSRDVCVQKLRADMKDDLNAQDCPGGIDSVELNECLQSIRTENCSNPIDTVSRLAACRTSDMCKKTNAPNH